MMLIESNRIHPKTSTADLIKEKEIIGELEDIFLEITYLYKNIKIRMKRT